MKQAILITAYKNYHHLEEIIQCFDANFEVYIHLDKKSVITNHELVSLRKYEIVKFVEQKYKVNWGGFNHLKAILYLIEKALQNPENYYFHLITGHDFPVKRSDFFVDFFNKNRNTEFLSYFDFPDPKSGWPGNNGLDRIEYFNLYDFWNAKNHKDNQKITFWIRFQKRFGFKRKISSRMPKLFGGSTYWSLSRDCVNYVIKFTQENKFVLNRFKYTLCAEEFYFQTLIMNSPFAKNVVNDNVRHIDWVARNGNNPAILDKTDFKKLQKTNAFFARRFDYPQSIDLLNAIKSTWI
ncbi:MAG: beta-1,6-N-acetylglucosaminyltransferase [Flavobacterium sp.]|nr:beta-1,6-N-acetylglucosaminyltransferase [Flavobacterium sp.]